MNLAPAFCRHESKTPESSEVTLCWTVLSWKSHASVSPTLTLTFAGSYLPIVLGSATSFTVCVGVPLLLPPVGVQLRPLSPLEPPQLARTSAVTTDPIAIFQTVTLASLIERNSPGLSLRVDSVVRQRKPHLRGRIRYVPYSGSSANSRRASRTQSAIDATVITAPAIEISRFRMSPIKSSAMPTASTGGQMLGGGRWNASWPSGWDCCSGSAISRSCCR